MIPLILFKLFTDSAALYDEFFSGHERLLILYIWTDTKR